MWFFCCSKGTSPNPQQYDHYIPQAHHNPIPASTLSPPSYPSSHPQCYFFGFTPIIKERTPHATKPNHIHPPRRQHRRRRPRHPPTLHQLDQSRPKRRRHKSCSRRQRKRRNTITNKNHGIPRPDCARSLPSPTIRPAQALKEVEK